MFCLITIYEEDFIGIELFTCSGSFWLTLKNTSDDVTLVVTVRWWGLAVQ